MTTNYNEHVESDINRSTESPVSVLFVCTANVCRSPTAHGVFLDFVARANYSDAFVVDSAGTKAQHSGKPPEGRAQKVALQAGYDLSDLRARPLAESDFDEFHYIIAMDSSHLEKINSMAPDEFKGSAALLMDYANEPEMSEVPDPYYGSTNDFRVALDLIEQGCIGLLEHIVAKLPTNTSP